MVVRLVGHFGKNKLLLDIDAPQISEWRDARLKEVQASTMLRESNLLRNMFTVARDEWRWIDHNPFRGVRLPQHNEPRTALWTWQLIRRMLRAQRTGKTAEMQRAFHIALHTAMRLEEVLTHQYDAARKVAIIPSSKTSTKPAAIPVTTRAARSLRGRTG